MLHAEFLHIFYVQLYPGFIGIDGFVLGSMIAKDPLNLWDITNSPKVEHEKHHPNQPFQKRIDQWVVVDIGCYKTAGEGWQKEKESTTNVIRAKKKK